VTLQAVGAGLGRTGTTSMKLALEQLLDGRCFDMSDVFGHPEVAQQWIRATDEDLPDWHELFRDYRATVDWPAAAFWREISAEFPDAIVILSTRDADDWWMSASRTIFPVIIRDQESGTPLSADRQMILDVLHSRFTLNWDDADAAKAAYLRHNQEVRATIDPARLVEWRPGDGWDPLCRALSLPVPETPYPHVNTTDEFRQLSGLDEAG
jgi:hypothetical protein